MSRRAAAGLLVVALAAAVTAIGCADTAPAVRPGERANEVRAYLPADPASLAFIVATDSAAEEVALQISDTLVQYDPGADMQLMPRVAASWSFSDDRLTVTFRLRDGVRWHDGTPVTADDVVFTLERLLDPLAENRTWAPLFRDLVDVAAPAPDRVVARYRVATPDVLEGWRFPLLPRHVADDGDPSLLAFARRPVGCGPFRFVSYEPGRRIVLEANDDYWDGAPAIDRLVYKIFADQRTAFQAMLTGDLDIMPVTANLLAEALGTDAAAGLRAFSFRRLNTTFVAWNRDGGASWFDDVRVRRALVHALDRPSFIDVVLDGYATPAATTYTPGTYWNDGGGPEPLAYDPELARRLLDEAGWVDTDGDGVRDRDGTPLHFELLTHRSSQGLVERLAVWQQDSWRAIGVAADVETLEFQAYRERRFAHQFDAVGGSLTFTPNPDQYELYHSSERDEGFNFFGLDDPETDRLLEAGRVTFDPEARREIYLDLQRRLAEIQALGFLFHFETPVLVDARLDGVNGSPLGYARTTDGPRLWRWPDE